MSQGPGYPVGCSLSLSSLSCDFISAMLQGKQDYKLKCHFGDGNCYHGLNFILWPGQKGMSKKYKTNHGLIEESKWCEGASNVTKVSVGFRIFQNVAIKETYMVWFNKVVLDLIFINKIFILVCVFRRTFLGAGDKCMELCHRSIPCGYPL